ncbi:MAG: DUF5103 domain-containing protein [Prolixibacteraceae bacterium]|nr:DUF5103 domain-containing protein [Prolixibacteraceae bacterium]
MSSIRFIFILFLCLLSFSGNAVRLPEVIENTIFSDNIKTVEMYRDGARLSNPVLTLNSEEQLLFSFDDLNNEKADLYYTIFHCDRNWKLSRIGQQEYLSSFTDFPITDFDFSRNTNMKYINYWLYLPNNDVPISLSGNYVLVVFNRNEPDVPLITWRFYVVEQQVGIEARIKRATHDPVNGENQEIDFNVKHGNFPIQNPHTDVKVVISQNNRTDNAIHNLKPLFVSNGMLEYEYDMENTFKGENEFRAFEFRSFNYPGEGVDAISLHPPLYHVTLLPHIPRVQKPYNFYKDLNGNFHVEVLNRNYPDIEADYMFVHFTLQVSKPLLGGGIYVFGKLSNWQCTKPYEMKYNMDSGQYELALLLKQGYYNFTYAYKDYRSEQIKPYNLEGSHHETENDYYIFVYYGRMNDRYDRLIGYRRFNSLADRGM